MHAGVFIPPEKVGRHIYVPLWDKEQRTTNKITVVIPAFLSVAQRNVSLRPQGYLITHYSLRRGRRAGYIDGYAENGY